MFARTAAPVTTELPGGYRLHEKLDLKNKKAAVTIQVVVAVVAAVMVGLGFLLDLPPTGWDGWTTAAATALACLLYMAVHELTHGAFLWMLSGVRPTVALRVPTSSPVAGRTSTGGRSSSSRSRRSSSGVLC